jgi:hypothetical protein
MAHGSILAVPKPGQRCSQAKAHEQRDASLLASSAFVPANRIKSPKSSKKGRLAALAMPV